MSYIPDTREDEDYKYSFLNKDDKDFIDGYDYCVEHAIDNFFNNLDNLDDSYLFHILHEIVPASVKEEYDFFFYDKSSEKREVKTYADLLCKYLFEWIERTRDEIIVSCIDNMSDKDYEKNREQASK